MCVFPVVPAHLLLGGVLGRRCARSVRGVACTVSWASWLLFTGVLAPCEVLRVRRPGPPGSCSPPCTPFVRCCVLGFLGLLAPAHRRARSVCGVAGAVSWAAWFLFPGVQALCVLLRARCPGPLGSCSPVCLTVFCVLCMGVRAVVTVAPHCIAGQDHWPPVTTTPWPKAIGLYSLLPCLWFPLPRCAVSCVRCPGPLGSGSPVCTRCVRCCMCGVLGLLAPVHRCACWPCALRMLPIPLPHPRLL